MGTVMTEKEWARGVLRRHVRFHYWPNNFNGIDSPEDLYNCRAAAEVDDLSDDELFHASTAIACGNDHDPLRDRLTARYGNPRVELPL